MARWLIFEPLVNLWLISKEMAVGALAKERPLVEAATRVRCKGDDGCGIRVSGYFGVSATRV